MSATALVLHDRLHRPAQSIRLHLVVRTVDEDPLGRTRPVLHECRKGCARLGGRRLAKGRRGSPPNHPQERLAGHRILLHRTRKRSTILRRLRRCEAEAAAIDPGCAVTRAVAPRCSGRALGGVVPAVRAVIGRGSRRDTGRARGTEASAQATGRTSIPRGGTGARPRRREHPDPRASSCTDPHRSVEAATTVSCPARMMATTSFVGAAPRCSDTECFPAATGIASTGEPPASRPSTRT